MTETHKELDKIKALLAEIGPERWYLVENGDDPLDICVSEDRVPVARLTMGYNDCIDDEQWRYAQLIVAARNHLPDIIEERDQAVSAYAGMKEALAGDQSIKPMKNEKLEALLEFEEEVGQLAGPDDTASFSWGDQRALLNEAILAHRAREAALPTGEAVTVVSDAQRDVMAERARQVTDEGWTPEHDDTHNKGEMAKAAACYAWASALPAYSRVVHQGDWWGTVILRRLWPWGREWWKPTNRRRDLVKACALILAEIERLDRAALSQKAEGDGANVRSDDAAGSGAVHFTHGPQHDHLVGEPLPPVEEGVPSGSGGQQPPLEFERAPCTGCGAETEGDALDLCKQHQDPAGEWVCEGEFDDDHFSIRATAESLAASEAWMQRNALNTPGEAPSPSKERVEKLEQELRRALRAWTSTDCSQYLLANTRKRGDGALKATWHKNLTEKFVAVFCGEDLNRVKSGERLEEYIALHDETADKLTDRLDEVIGFDIDGFVSDELRDRFFDKFYEIARALLSDTEGK